MCYYNGIRVSKEEFLRLKNEEKLLKKIHIPVQSGFQYTRWPIIKPIANSWDFELAHWELIAPWVKTPEAQADSRKKFNTLNATSERLLESKMYKEAALMRRCLVLSSGFFEWMHVGKQTYPHYITTHQAGLEQVFFMAGIYNNNVDHTTGEIFSSFSIVTTAANSLMERIHNTKKRMPTILSLELAEEWISDIPESRVAEIAKYQIPTNDMVAYPIAKNFQSSDDPFIRVDYPELALI